MNPLLLRFAPYALGGAAFLGAALWLRGVLDERTELRDWQITVLSELSATAAPDAKGVVEMLKPSEAVDVIRSLGDSYRAASDGLRQCNQSALALAESRERAVADARKAVAEANKAQAASDALRARLAAERAAGATCAPLPTAGEAWRRLGQ